MPQILLYLTLAFSATTTLMGLLLLLGVGRKPPQSPLAQAADAIAATVRTEADRSRTDSAEQARGIRQEVGVAIQRFQDSFTQRLEAGIEGVRQPVTEIGQKLDADIAKMGLEAGQGREALRATIETKLDAYGDRQMNAARDLRTELVDSFARTTATVSQTMKDLGTHQQERLEKVAAELAGMSERQGTAQEALRQAVESRLDAIRQENAAKLDEMRQTWTKSCRRLWTSA